MALLLLLAVSWTSVSSFLIIDAEPGIQVVSPGARVKLFCAVDDDYEYCKFISPQQQVCDFEWKRSEGNITMQTCDLDTDNKQVSFHGKYNDRECGISFTAGEEDSGVWKCEVEEYVWGGSRGSGRKVWAQMNVTVMVATTPPPRGDTATASTTTTTTTTTATTTSDNMRTSTTTTESGDGGAIPDAVPRTQEDGAGGDVTATVLGVLAVLGIIAAAVCAVLYWRRKQSLKRPDAGAAVVYDRETRQNKDTATMVAQRPVSTASSMKELHTEDPDTRNLHEFFPNSDSFA